MRERFINSQVYIVAAEGIAFDVLGHSILSHIDQDAGSRSFFSRLQEPRRGVFVDVFLTAVLTHTCRHASEDECHRAACERYGRIARPGLAMLADRTFHQ